MSKLRDESIIWRRNPNGRLEKVTVMAGDQPPSTEQLLATVAELAKKLADQEALIKKLQTKAAHREDDDWYDSDKDIPKTKSDKRVEKLEEVLRNSTLFNEHFLNEETWTVDLKGKVPEKVDPSDLPKFSGTKNPCNYMRNFLSFMALKGIDAQIYPNLFPLTLIKYASTWYGTLPSVKAKNWNTLKKEFHTQYNYNLKLEMTQWKLEVTKQKDKESFTDFLSQWRTKAA